MRNTALLGGTVTLPPFDSMLDTGPAALNIQVIQGVCCVPGCGFETRRGPEGPSQTRPTFGPLPTSSRVGGPGFGHHAASTHLLPPVTTARLGVNGAPTQRSFDMGIRCSPVSAQSTKKQTTPTHLPPPFGYSPGPRGVWLVDQILP